MVLKVKNLALVGMVLLSILIQSHAQTTTVTSNCPTALTSAEKDNLLKLRNAYNDAHQKLPTDGEIDQLIVAGNKQEILKLTDRVSQYPQNTDFKLKYLSSILGKIKTGIQILKTNYNYLIGLSTEEIKQIQNKINVLIDEQNKLVVSSLKDNLDTLNKNLQAVTQNFNNKAVVIENAKTTVKDTNDKISAL
jgi:hypothetical protein